MPFNKLHILHLAIEVQQHAALCYELGRQSRSYKNVWCIHIYPKYHISYATFLKYLKIDAEWELKELVELKEREKQRVGGRATTDPEPVDTTPKPDK